MAERKPDFDADGFYFALDSARKARGYNWKQVSAETNVHASTLTRMAQGQRPDAGSLASLSAWAVLNPADFVRNVVRKEQPDTLTQIGASLSQDPNLTPQNATIIRETVKNLYDALMKK